MLVAGPHNGGSCSTCNEVSTIAAIRATLGCSLFLFAFACPLVDVSLPVGLGFAHVVHRGAERVERKHASQSSKQNEFDNLSRRDLVTDRTLPLDTAPLSIHRTGPLLLPRDTGTSSSSNYYKCTCFDRQHNISKQRTLRATTSIHFNRRLTSLFF